MWDQDHVDDDEELPTIYYDVDDPENGNFIIINSFWSFFPTVKRDNKPKAEVPEFDPESVSNYDVMVP